MSLRSTLSTLLAALFVGTVTVHAAPASPPPTPPNVLFIAIDDLNDWVGFLKGHPQAKTPNMDRLAKRGTAFLNAHCQAPLCNPSRSSIMTGLRPSTTGIYGLAPGIRAVESLKTHVTLNQHFRNQGYYTYTCGKIYHDGSIPRPQQTNEFDVWGPSPGMPKPPKKFVQTPDNMLPMDWGVFPENDADQPDWKTADNAIAQIESAPKNRPFFIAAGFRLPHVPCYASQKWFDMFPEESVTLPPVKQNDRDDVPPFAWYLHWKLPEPRLSYLIKDNQWKPLVRSYLATTTFMDSQLGRVLDALEKSGKEGNTVVVLWSDHGWHVGEKAITGKNTLWERSTHVPLIFAGPGITAGARCSQPAELLDMYPTLVDLCGLPKREGLEGHSLVPQLRDAKTKREWPAITTANAGNHTVRSERYRFIQYADGSQEFYDMQTDPNEWTNLVKDPKYAKLIDEHARWMPKTSTPAVPGSAHRILEKIDGFWVWEGKRINPSELED